MLKRYDGLEVGDQFQATPLQARCAEWDNFPIHFNNKITRQITTLILIGYICQFKFSVQKVLEMNVCVKLENKIKKIARHNRFQALIQTPRVVTISMT